MASSPPAAGTFLLATAVLWVSSLSQEESTSDGNGIKGRVDPSRPSVETTLYHHMMVDEIDNGKEGSIAETYLNCFVKSSSTSSSSQLSCQSGSAFPPDALFSDSNTLPDCSATSQLVSHFSSLRASEREINATYLLLESPDCQRHSEREERGTYLKLIIILQSAQLG